MQKPRALLVDDEPAFLNVLVEWMTSWGYETVAVYNGADAVSAVENNNFDVIILDYIMPHMNGLIALEKIRKINPNVDVIILTAHPAQGSVASAKKLNISAYVSKLDNIESVYNTLKSVLSIIGKRKST
ncbi:MAG: response regulator [Candidatus Omnitrophica bacterium]|nr:response regulator [Candidatus Omnitrophota bacterium]